MITAHDPDDRDHESLSDIPIFRYTDLPPDVVDAFIATGTPPEGFVLIVFCEDSHGCSLIHESHLELIDRSLRLGDRVKSDLADTVSGIVIGATSKCTLEPIAYQPLDPSTGDFLPVRFTENPFGDFEGHSVFETRQTRPCMLFEVPQSELCEHEEFSEGDQIIFRQRLGIVEKVERDVILLLSNSKAVSPLDSFALEVPTHANPATALLSSDLKKRQIGNAKYVWTTDDVEDVYPGQSVFVERTNLSHLDRPCGREDVLQSYVLAKPAEDIHIRWLCPNVFSTEPQHPSPSYEVLRVSQLHENAIKCDFTQPVSHSTLAAKCDSEFIAGDRVRFRDPAYAEKRYPGYRPIPTDQTYGYDLNIFRIIATRTEVLVQWQDGRRTAENANCLVKIDTEDGLLPGTVVALKDDVNDVNGSVDAGKMHNSHSVRGQTAHTLRAQIGIIQQIDQEQIASVRWFQGKGVELMFDGDALNPDSSLGRLGDMVEHLSVYELATFPALYFSVGASVVVAPTSVDQAVMSSTRNHRRSKDTGPCDLFVNSKSYLDLSNKLQSIKLDMINSDWFKETTTIRPPSPRRRYSLHREGNASTNDFFGQIVAISSEGVISVRFPGLNGCRDAQVPLEKILMVLPPDLTSSFEFSNWRSVGGLTISSSDNYDVASDDSDVSGGESSLEDKTDSPLSSDESIRAEPMKPKTIQSEGNGITAADVSAIHLDDYRTLCKRRSMKDNASASRECSPPRAIGCRSEESSPPGFAVLGDLPPSDHHFLNESGSSALYIKHILREFAILETSLPPGIFVRSWESRMDILRVLIIGPDNTPYEHAPFVFDLHFTSNFPSQPPSAFFHSWTLGQGRVNPNLYEDGGICLSILGTWPTRSADEAWSPGKSTVLQILVSLMGLVLVKQPFYNEAGYEVLAAQGARSVESAKYTEKAFLMTRKFIVHALEHPVCGLEDVLAWHYLPGLTTSSVRPNLSRKAIQSALDMIRHYHRTSPQTGSYEPATAFCSRLSLGAAVALQKQIDALERLLSV